ncbi:MAG: hypothetical protein K0S74_55 [Chlamydiales bacterium]|jgi:hypothetical protein|nr:hypothetical protein [Chlamydiales bacterium]
MLNINQLLPKEILHNIFFYIKEFELDQSKRVCKLWDQVIKEYKETLYRKICGSLSLDKRSYQNILVPIVLNISLKELESCEDLKTSSLNKFERDRILNGFKTLAYMLDEQARLLVALKEIENQEEIHILLTSELIEKVKNILENWSKSLQRPAALNIKQKFYGLVGIQASDFSKDSKYTRPIQQLLEELNKIKWEYELPLKQMLLKAAYRDQNYTVQLHEQKIQEKIGITNLTWNNLKDLYIIGLDYQKVKSSYLANPCEIKIRSSMEDWEKKFNLWEKQPTQRHSDVAKAFKYFLEHMIRNHKSHVCY